MSVQVAGGGSIAVDTESMVAAARALQLAADALDGIRGRIAGCAADPVLLAVPAARERLEAAGGSTAAALRCAELAGDGLRTAAVRYGVAEHVIADAQRATWAGGAAAIGTLTRIGTLAIGPGALVITGVGVLEVAGGALALEMLHELATTGTMQPQLDPVVLGALRHTLSSLDDVTRGFLLTEGPADVLRNDPAAPYGSEDTAAALAALLPVGDSAIRLRSRSTGAVDGPGDLVGLVGRIPSADPGDPQLRIERYGDGDGSRWIVYIGGTITFAPDSGTEPFDLASDLGGVGHVPTASETAVIQAMHDAGVQPGDPVLLVGHSQGALDAVRVAQDGGFTVGGVVQVGGPSGQIVMPTEVPVLAFEHDQDPVPVLGGLAAVGAPGLRRIVVSRSLPAGGVTGTPAPFAAGFPSHGMPAYTETVRQAEAAGDPRVDDFTEHITPFLAASGGTGALVQASRYAGPAPVSRYRAPRGGAAAAR